MHSIIVSRKDSAGMNIARSLIGGFGFSETPEKYRNNRIYRNPENKNFELVFIDGFQIFADHLADLNTDSLVFASCHSSESGRPALTVHAPGNWGRECRFGGKPNALVPASAATIKNYLRGLQEQKEKNKTALSAYGVSLEVTHHGPFLKKPAVFIELGSCEKDWKDGNAAAAIAETILGSSPAESKSESSKKGKNSKAGAPQASSRGLVCAVGIGGGHYAPEFTKLVLRTDYAISHIVPEYALKDFDLEMLKKAISSTIEPVQEIVIDWKGLGKEKARVMELLENQETQNLPVRRVRKLLQNA